MLRDEFGRYLSTARAVAGTKAARAWLRLFCGTWEPTAPMPRENSKWQTHEEQSTDAERRDGSAHTSDETE